MDSLQDLLQKKVNSLDTPQQNDMQLAQRYIGQQFGNGIEVAKIHEGKVFVATKSSPMASELRMQQSQIVEHLNGSLTQKVTKLIIQIR